MCRTMENSINLQNRNLSTGTIFLDVVSDITITDVSVEAFDRELQFFVILIIGTVRYRWEEKVLRVAKDSILKLFCSFSFCNIFLLFAFHILIAPLFVFTYHFLCVYVQLICILMEILV